MTAAADPATPPLVLPLPSLWVTPPKPVVAQPFQSTTGYNTPSLLPPSPSQWAPPTEEAMACSEDVHFPSPYFPSPHRVAFKRKGPPRSGGVALAVQVALRNRSLPNMRGPSSRRRPLAPQGATAGGGVCAEHTWPSPGLAIIDSLPHLRQPEAPSGGDPATARSMPTPQGDGVAKLPTVRLPRRRPRLGGAPPGPLPNHSRMHRRAWLWPGCVPRPRCKGAAPSSRREHAFRAYTLLLRRRGRGLMPFCLVAVLPPTVHQWRGSPRIWPTDMPPPVVGHLKHLSYLRTWMGF